MRAGHPLRMSDDLRARLAEEIHRVDWKPLAPHAKRGGLVLVDPELDLLDVALAVARDDGEVLCLSVEPARNPLRSRAWDRSIFAEGCAPLCSCSMSQRAKRPRNRRLNGTSAKASTKPFRAAHSTSTKRSRPRRPSHPGPKPKRRLSCWSCSIPCVRITRRSAATRARPRHTFSRSSTVAPPILAERIPRATGAYRATLAISRACRWRATVRTTPEAAMTPTKRESGCARCSSTHCATTFQPWRSRCASAATRLCSSVTMVS